MKNLCKATAALLCAVTLFSCTPAGPVTDGTTLPPETDLPTDNASTEVTTEAATADAVTTLPPTITVPVKEDKASAKNDGEVDYMFSNGEYYHNYIELYDLNGTLYRIGDPYVMRYDGMYYLYSSITSGHVNGDIYVWRSENLVDWECRGICVTSQGQNGITYTAYAPEVVYYGGYFWLCEAPEGKGHYIFRSESPEGPFTVASDNLGKGIDGSFYVADNGELYFMYAKSGTGGSIRYDKVSFGLNYSKAALPTGDGSALTASTNGWTEGPGYFRRGDYFYLTYTGNHVRDKSYRVAYSYTTAPSLLSNLIQPKYNITIMTTDTPYPHTNGGYGSKSTFDPLTTFSGTGHSSNTVGPNLDSIYTAFHNEESGKFNRRMNIVRYFTNGSYVLTDGLCLTDARKPVLPDYSARSAEELDTAGAYKLSKNATEAVYTAEINFLCKNKEAELVLGYKDEKNYVSVKISNGSMHVYKYENGDVEALGNVALGKGIDYEKLMTLYAVNGAGRCDIYINNMKKLSLDTSLAGGKIGAANADISSLFFTNDAFGTSDFEAVKNLPCSFPAYTYLKGENRGFSIKNATVNANGVRQGEKESTVYSNPTAPVTGGVNGYAATVLETGDWIKYAVSCGNDDHYALNLTVTAASAGCELELIVDDEYIYDMQISDVIKGKDGIHNVQAGIFELKKGEHTLKLRVKKGTLGAVNVHIEDGAKPIDPISSDLTSKVSKIIKIVSGNYSLSKSAGIRALSGDPAMFTFADSAYADFDLTVSVKVSDASKSGGIMFRAGDFNVNNNGGSEYTLNGYYLQFAERKLTLWKYSWNLGEKLESVAFLSTKERVYTEDEFTTVRIVAKDGFITVYDAGEKIMEVYDSEAFLSGYCAFYAPQGSFAFKDLIFHQTEK